jgi:hypothetical protein
MHDIYKVTKTAAKTIKFPNSECVTLPEGLQACSEARAVVLLARCSVAVEVPLRHACSQ